MKHTTNNNKTTTIATKTKAKKAGKSLTYTCSRYLEENT